MQGKRAALRSATLMIRQPIQRLGGMQASDIDIYRKITREKTSTMVRSARACMRPVRARQQAPLHARGTTCSAPEAPSFSLPRLHPGLPLSRHTPWLFVRAVLFCSVHASVSTLAYTYRHMRARPRVGCTAPCP